MKKTIEGKVYNTDTAVQIGKICRGEKQNNLTESLFQKKTGEFFLHITGGWAENATISPLIYTDAQSWAKDNLDSSVYENVFGSIQSDTHKIMLNLSLPANIVEKVKRAAAIRGISTSAYISQLIEKSE